MSDALQELEVRNATGFRFAVAKSRYNAEVTAGLCDGAVAYLNQTGADYAVYEAPGAFELPLICGELLAQGYHGVIALGAVIEGETDHYEHVAARASEGLM